MVIVEFEELQVAAGVRAVGVETVGVKAHNAIFERAFKVAHRLPCDVPLGSHPAMYNLDEKYARLGEGRPNPFIDPASYKLEVDIAEAMFRAVLADQQKAAAARER